MIQTSQQFAFISHLDEGRLANNLYFLISSYFKLQNGIFSCNTYKWTLTLLMVKSSLALSQFAFIQEGVFNIAEEARRDNPVD